MKTILTVFALFFSTLVSATPLDKIVVFGDSLSDNGNLYDYLDHEFPPSPPYHQGRFTNGPIWIELLAASYYPEDAAAHVQDFAFGGAGVTADEDALFSLTHEIDSYFLAHHDKADEHSLYVVWIGSNNYLSLPDSEDEPVSQVIKGINDDLKRLADKGAKHILVVGVPDLGQTPAAREMDAVEQLTDYSLQHNQTLSAAVSDLKNLYPDVQWIYYDVNKPFTDMLAAPEKYGFTNIKDTCYEAMMSQTTSQPILKMVSTVKAGAGKGNCDGYLFFDLVHPSGLAHQVMNDKVKELLDEAGVEFH